MRTRQCSVTSADGAGSQLRSAPFPPEWVGVIERNVPFYASLPETDRRELQGHVQVFLAEKNFEGCNGLELTDEIKVTIAAHACRLLLHRDTEVFPRLITVLVYPSAYVAKSVEPIGGGGVPGGRAGAAGRGMEGRSRGRLVGRPPRRPSGGATPAVTWSCTSSPISSTWRTARRTGRRSSRAREQYASWIAVMEDEYERLRRDSRLGRYSVLDPTAPRTRPSSSPWPRRRFSRSPRCSRGVIRSFTRSFAGSTARIRRGHAGRRG